MLRTRMICFIGLATLLGCGGGNPNDQRAAIQGGASAAGCTPAAPNGQTGCDPLDTKKTTICHIPPGNPANAHTLCVGNEAVPAHLAHGDSLDACLSICPPPVDGGASDDASPGGDIPGGDIPSTPPPGPSPDLSAPPSSNPIG
jgi:hypothetical protein